MRKNIEIIRNLLNEQIEENRAFSAKTEAVKEDGTYTEEYKRDLIAKLTETHTENANKKRDEIISAIEELKGKEKTVIDLADSRLSNAISLVC